MARETTVQRSFRLRSSTLQRLEQRARETAESRNALAERLLDEALRAERHPLVHFRLGGSGLRRPALIGTRLYIWQVVETVRGEGGDVGAGAEYFGLPRHLVQAAVDYYAEFTEEVDAYRDAEYAFAAAEQERSERAQRIFE